MGDEFHDFRIAALHDRIGEGLRLGDDEDLCFLRHLGDQNGERFDEDVGRVGFGFIEDQPRRRFLGERGAARLKKRNAEGQGGGLHVCFFGRSPTEAPFRHALVQGGRHRRWVCRGQCWRA